MDIQHKETATKGSFFIRDNNEELAEMTYSKLGTSKIIIDHTEVTQKLRGTGAGKKLVYTAVHFARKQNLKIIPLCPFAKVVFDQNPDIQDVLK